MKTPHLSEISPLYALLMIGLSGLFAPILTSIQPAYAAIPEAMPEQQAPTDNATRISPFSGLKVPRFSSLAYNKVNGRAGPGFNYPKRWLYQRRGLPVLVVKESPDWRKIRDPDGEEVWVHKRMLVVRRTGILRETSLLYPPAGEGENPIAKVYPGVVGELTGCNRHWCKMRIKGHQGRIRSDAIWGHALGETSRINVESR